VEPVMDVYLAATRTTAEAPSLLDLMVTADPIVQLDLLLLVAMSVACWGIIAQKARRLHVATTSSAAFLEVFWNAKRLDAVYEQVGQFNDSPVASVFKAGYKELARMSAGGKVQEPDANLARSLRRAAQVEATQLERYIPFLATTGSTAPFIGLFGTVWGILQAFLKLGTPGAVATIQVVGPDIAHALVATAVGLVAAIPAVMAYNYFNAQIRVLDAEMDNFSADFLNLIKRRAT
jgi:biopolymer transport protein TolQ